MDIRTFQDNTKMLRRWLYHTQTPILHLKDHIWSESAEKRLRVYKSTRLNSMIWSNVTWDTLIQGRTMDWTRGKPQERVCLILSICLCYPAYGRLRSNESYSSMPRVGMTSEEHLMAPPYKMDQTTSKISLLRSYVFELLWNRNLQRK